MHFIIHKKLNIESLRPLMLPGNRLELDQEMAALVDHGRRYLDNKLDATDTLFYGINTGFGSLCNIGISKSELADLQYNLIRSHACGMGKTVPLEIIRLMLVLKIQSLAYGHSGVTSETVEALIALYNADALPVIYEQGSLGASGDLAPLAHLAMPLIGEGELWYKEERRASAGVLSEIGLKPLALKAKEGLALLNGTQFMSAYGVYAILMARELLDKADFIAAASHDAFDGRIEPFHPAIHSIRPHPGQQQSARNLLNFLKDSCLQQQSKTAVQDPYSFRCIPQVHGASRDICRFVQSVFEIEINAVSDNPNLFPEEDLILSGGNFHGQPLALALDQLGMAMAEIGSISERRIFQLVSGSRGLPAFLSPNSGLNSGFMIPQYTAASIASQNKQLAVPASIDTISSSNGQEDHVSMGANAATKLYLILENTLTILGIEWLNACQALDFRSFSSSPVIETAKTSFRKRVSKLENDRYMHPDMQEAVSFVRELKL
jgi:histidine ammonia-lyase